VKARILLAAPFLVLATPIFKRTGLGSIVGCSWQASSSALRCSASSAISYGRTFRSRAFRRLEHEVVGVALDAVRAVVAEFRRLGRSMRPPLRWWPAKARPSDPAEPRDDWEKRLWFEADRRPWNHDGVVARSRGWGVVSIRPWRAAIVR